MKNRAISCKMMKSKENVTEKIGVEETEEGRYMLLPAQFIQRLLISTNRCPPKES